MKKSNLWTTVKLGSLLLLVGCASNPNKIPASYVSPFKYKAYDCDQIIVEMDYVSKRTVRLFNSLEKDHKNDQAQMGVGLLLFWPTLFFLEGGDGPEAAQYADLKGEFEALRQASVQKRCEIEMESPDEIIEKIAEQNKKKRKPGPPANVAR